MCWSPFHSTATRSLAPFLQLLILVLELFTLLEIFSSCIPFPFCFEFNITSAGGARVSSSGGNPQRYRMLPETVGRPTRWLADDFVQSHAADVRCTSVCIIWLVKQQPMKQHTGFSCDLGITREQASSRLGSWTAELISPPLPIHFSLIRVFF